MQTHGATHNILDFLSDWGELEGMNSSATPQPKVVIRLSHMGDVALITGVLSYWNEKHCDTFIVITRKGNAPLLVNHPAVVEVIELEDTELKTLAWFNKSRHLAARFKGHTLVDLHGTLRSRILSLVWKGSVKRYPKFGLERRLYDRTHAETYRKKLEATNVTQRYAMAYSEKPPQAATLVPQLYLTDSERAEASVLLSSMATGKPVVAIHPYATHPSKQWPRQHWLELTGHLASAGYDWFVIGRDTAPLFDNHEREFTNQTGLRETCALMEKADLLITADSGPMHLACGVGTPVVALFGPTVKAWGFYPAGPKDTVLELNTECRPCSLHGGKACDKGFECLSKITPEMVLNSVRHTLSD